ncbi:MAG: hypothetical protein KAJ40_01445 [Alphaproteobacteria bacterium]|nr:hypothetical protein [Alphaproteobacteria bacterium]
MISTIVVVALSGAVGATMRHTVNVGDVRYFGHGYPWGTMIVNIGERGATSQALCYLFGSVILGILALIAGRWIMRSIAS